MSSDGGSSDRKSQDTVRRICSGKVLERVHQSGGAGGGPRQIEDDWGSTWSEGSQRSIHQKQMELRSIQTKSELQKSAIDISTQLELCRQRQANVNKKIKFFGEHPDLNNAANLLVENELKAMDLEEEIGILEAKLKSIEDLVALETKRLEDEKMIADEIRALEEEDDNPKSVRSVRKSVTSWVAEATRMQNSGAAVETAMVDEAPLSGQPRVDAGKDEDNISTVPSTCHSGDMDGLISALTTLASSMQNKEERIVVKDSSDKKLPIFNGRDEDWVSFKGAFERSTKFYKLDHQQNFARLMLSLKGTAKEAVKGVFNNPNNVPEILKVLEKEFGSPKFIIECLIDKVEKCQVPDIKKPETVKQFARAIRTLESSIEAHGMKDYANNGYLLKKLVDRLPTDMKERWLDWVFSGGGRTADMKHFSVWMGHQYDKACEMSRAKIEETVGENVNRGGKKGPRAFASAAPAPDKENKGYCDNCGKGHNITVCFGFKRLTVLERRAVAKEKRLCYICLQKGHGATKCKVVEVCNVDNCGQRHHQLLHLRKPARCQEKAVSVEQAAVFQDNEEEDQGSMGVASSADLLPVIRIVVHGPTGTKKIYALLDTGCSFNMIEAEVAENLGLSGKREPISFIVYGDKRKEKNSQNLKLDISGAFKGASKFSLKSVHTVGTLGLPNRTFDAEELKRKYPHLRKMRAESMFGAEIQMIIGITELDLMAAREILETDSRDDPNAVRCKLGWYVGERRETLEKSFQLALQTDEDELHKMMKHFFSVEAFGVKVTQESQRSKDDRKALEILKSTTKKVGDRYETGLLFKDKNPVVPETKAMAMKRLKTMERQMDNTPEMKQLCLGKFGEYVEKGYLKPRKEGVDDRRMYLPWFFNYHPNKKPRLVFDGAAKGADGRSLNDLLLKGPDLIQPLATVLLRFRRYRVAITGDIKEMFHRVKLRKEDQPFQTVLYRGVNRDAAPVEFQMTVLFFGSASSPCSAIFTKDLNAEQFEEQYPDAVKAIKQDHYVDDYCGCAPTENEALRLQRQVTEIHAAGGFDIVKWNSNSEEVLSAIPEEIRAQPGVTAFAEKTELSMERTLGLQWDPKSDDFSFNTSYHRVPREVVNGDRRPTKREMASLVMSVYDPLGFLCPFRIRALVILQQTWKTGIGWDDELPGDLCADWMKWVEDLRSIVEVKIPRCYALLLDSCSNVSSQESYASAVYLRSETGGSVEVSLVMGKCRVAPIKGLTIPRMELLAALMGTRLACSVKAVFAGDFPINKWYFWSDSKTVLCWIRSTTARYNQFVGNRIGEILEKTDAADWHWVPTGENVADDATRASKALIMTSESRWLTGPRFLQLPEHYWFQENKKETADGVNEEDLEMKKVVASAVMEDSVHLPDICQYSSWMRLTRATAARWMIARKIKKKETGLFIKPVDMEQASQLWIRQVQKDSFGDDLKQLKSGGTVAKNSKLKMLSPVLNQEGIIVLGGRIDAADVKKEVKHPPMLDNRHRYTQLLIEWCHRNNGHQGQETVINQLRQKVWILNCREAVRCCCAKCLFCCQRRAKPVPPMMGQLPVCRLGKRQKVFYQTGVDYFGPFIVNINRRPQKRWGVLFTCLATRAVHLEVTDSMDTSEMVNAFTRFIALRGSPAHMWSDNGTNFQGANREMKESLAEWNQAVIQEHLTSKGVEWHFIPPAAPHMGGSWERIVGSVKKVLQVILKEQSMSDTRLRTLFCEVMDSLNSRPLTYASPDPEDPTCLTPNHFLKMEVSTGPTIAGVYEKKDCYRKDWRHVQYLADQFWKRWTIEYLPTLARREKWQKSVDPLKVGDVVLVVDDQVPRSTWKKGMIVATFPAKDGQVRKVDVRVANVKAKEKGMPVTFTTYRRPAVKVCPILVAN